jgi:hypothetical protein
MKENSIIKTWGKIDKDISATVNRYKNNIKYNYNIFGSLGYAFISKIIYNVSEDKFISDDSYVFNRDNLSVTGATLSDCINEGLLVKTASNNNANNLLCATVDVNYVKHYNVNMSYCTNDTKLGIFITNSNSDDKKITTSIKADNINTNKDNNNSTINKLYSSFSNTVTITDEEGNNPEYLTFAIIYINNRFAPLVRVYNASDIDFATLIDFEDKGTQVLYNNYGKRYKIKETEESIKTDNYIALMGYKELQDGILSNIKQENIEYNDSISIDEYPAYSYINKNGLNANFRPIVNDNNELLYTLYEVSYKGVVIHSAIETDDILFTSTGCLDDCNIKLPLTEDTDLTTAGYTKIAKDEEVISDIKEAYNTYYIDYCKSIPVNNYILPEEFFTDDLVLYRDNIIDTKYMVMNNNFIIVYCAGEFVYFAIDDTTNVNPDSVNANRSNPIELLFDLDEEKYVFENRYIPINDGVLESIYYDKKYICDINRGGTEITYSSPELHFTYNRYLSRLTKFNSILYDVNAQFPIRDRFGVNRPDLYYRYR